MLPDLISNDSPDSLNDLTASLARETLMKLTPMTNQDLLGLKEIEDERVSAVIKLYNSMAVHAFMCRSERVLDGAL